MTPGEASKTPPSSVPYEPLFAVDRLVQADRELDLFVASLIARLYLYTNDLGAWVRLSADGECVEVGRRGRAQLCLGFRRAYAIDRPIEAARVTVERLLDPTAVEPQFRVYVPPGEDV